jgi:hypothetical protein
MQQIILESTQKLPKIAKICPKTISLRNFEIPPKIEILVFFQKKKVLCVEGTLENVYTIWVFNIRNFHILFLL